MAPQRETKKTLQNHDAFMLGGQHADSLEGGVGNDLLLGRAVQGGRQVLEDIYEDAAAGQFFVEVNGGMGLVVLEGDKRILINDGQRLGIVLTGSSPDLPTPTLSGDFKKKIDPKEAGDPDDDEYMFENSNYVNDGQWRAVA